MLKCKSKLFDWVLHCYPLDSGMKNCLQHFKEVTKELLLFVFRESSPCHRTCFCTIFGAAVWRQSWNSTSKVSIIVLLLKSSSVDTIPGASKSCANTMEGSRSYFHFACLTINLCASSFLFLQPPLWKLCILLPVHTFASILITMSWSSAPSCTAREAL